MTTTLLRSYCICSPNQRDLNESWNLRPTPSLVVPEEGVPVGQTEPLEVAVVRKKRWRAYV